MLSPLIALFIGLQQAPGGGQALIESSHRVLRAASSVTLTASVPDLEGGPLRLTAIRGGYSRLKSGNLEVVSTPGRTFRLMSNKEQYEIAPDPPVTALEVLPLPGLEALRSLLPLEAAGPAILAEFADRHAYRIQIVKEPRDPFLKDTRLFVDAVTALPLGFEVTEEGSQTRVRYEGLTMNKVSKTDFDWSPPKDWARLETEPVPEASLLPVGSSISDFVATDATGQVLRFRRDLLGTRGTIVNFWSYG